MACAVRMTVSCLKIIDLMPKSAFAALCPRRDVKLSPRGLAWAMIEAPHRPLGPDRIEACWWKEETTGWYREGSPETAGEGVECGCRGWFLRGAEHRLGPGEDGPPRAPQRKSRGGGNNMELTGWRK